MVAGIHETPFHELGGSLDDLFGSRVLSGDPRAPS